MLVLIATVASVLGVATIVLGRLLTSVKHALQTLLFAQSLLVIGLCILWGMTNESQSRPEEERFGAMPVVIQQLWGVSIWFHGFSFLFLLVVGHLLTSVKHAFRTVLCARVLLVTGFWILLSCWWWTTNESESHQPIEERFAAVPVVVGTSFLFVLLPALLTLSREHHLVYIGYFIPFSLFFLCTMIFIVVCYDLQGVLPILIAVSVWSEMLTAVAFVTQPTQ
jgi:hypothetical protein